MRSVWIAAGTVGTTTVIASPLLTVREGSSAGEGAANVKSVGGGFGPLRLRQAESGSIAASARTGLFFIVGLIIRKFPAAKKDVGWILVYPIGNRVEGRRHIAEFHHQDRKSTRLNSSH